MTVVSSSNANITPDTWHNVSFTYNRFTSNVNLLVDNVSVGQSENVYINLTKSDVNFALGYNHDSDGESHFVGAMNDIVIYNRELTDAELTYLFESNKKDLFLKNELVGELSVDQFTEAANTFLTQNGVYLNKIGAGVTGGTTSPLDGAGSISFQDVDSYVALPNNDMSTGFMSYGAWVRPTSATNASFLEKDGMFRVGTDVLGNLEIAIGGISNKDTRYTQSALGVPDPKFRLLFDSTLKDVQGNTTVKGKHVNYVNTNYNNDALNRVIVHTSNTEINLGTVLDKLEDANQVTMSMWVNATELETGKTYPLLSTNNGFEFFVSNDGTGKMQLNFMQVDNTIDASIQSFAVDSSGTSATVKTSFSGVTSNREVRALITPLKYDTKKNADIKTLIAYSKLVPMHITGAGNTDDHIASDRLTVTAGTTFNNTSGGTSSLISGGYFQTLPNGDKIHSSEAFQSSRAVSSLFDNITNNWANAWHGPNNVTTMTAIYEFNENRKVYSMDFGQAPGNNHFTGLINIYYWDGSAFVECQYQNTNAFTNAVHSEVITVYFDTVSSSRFKIQINKHASNNTTYIGLSEWTLYQSIDAAGTVPAPPLTSIEITTVVSEGKAYPLSSVNHGYLYLLHSATDGLKETKIIEDTTTFAKDQVYDPEEFEFDLTPADIVTMGDFSAQRTFTNMITSTKLQGVDNNIFLMSTNRMRACKDHLVFIGGLRTNSPGYDASFASTYGANFTTHLIVAKRNASTGVYEYWTNVNMFLPVPYFVASANSTSAKSIAYFDISENMNWVIIRWDTASQVEQTVLYKRVPGTDGAPLAYEYCQTVKDLTTANTTAYGVAVSEKFYVAQDTISANAGIVIYKLNKDGETWELAKRYAYTDLRTLTGATDIPVNHTYGCSIHLSHNTLVICTYGSPYNATIFTLTDQGSLISEAAFKDVSTGLIDCATWGDHNVLVSRYQQGYQLWSKLATGTWALVHNQTGLETGYSGQWGHCCAMEQNRYFIGVNGQVNIAMYEGAEVTKELKQIKEVPKKDKDEIDYRPLVTLIPYFENFENNVKIGGTIFSAYRGIFRVYNPVMFVLSDTFTNEVITPTYVKNYVKTKGVGYQTLNLPKRTVRELNYIVETVINEAGTHVPIDLQNKHVAYMLIVEDTGEEHVMLLGKSDNIISVREIDWTKSNFTNNGENYVIVPQAGPVWYGTRNAWSKDGKKFVSSNTSANGAGNGSGWARVYEYDEFTDAWGKFDASGSFTKDGYHNLSKSSTYGQYGQSSAISLDGKTVAVGGEYDYLRGCCYVWQFDESTALWGKWNADGSHTPGTPHDLSFNTIPTWPAGTYPDCFYGRHVSLTGDGKRLMVGGPYNNNQRFRVYFWDYDDVSAAWGGYDTSGNFVLNTPYMINKNNGNWGYNNVMTLSMSADGKRFLFSNYISSAAGKAGVMYYNDETHQWGLMNADGSFKQHVVGSSDNLDHYNLDLSSARCHYGMRSTISLDGKTCIIGGYEANGSGNCVVWHFNEETYQWGEWKSDGSFSTTVDVNRLYKSSTGNHYGHAMDVTADGHTIIMSGQNSTSGRAYIWQYNEETHEWGMFDANGTFTKPASTTDHTVPHIVYNTSSGSFADGCRISPNGLFFYITGDSRHRMWKGADTGEKAVVPFGDFSGVSITTLSRLRTEIDTVEFNQLKYGGGAEFVVQNTDWSEETNKHDNANPDYFVPAVAAQQFSAFSGDGKKLISYRYTSTSAGNIYVYDYNEELDKWGKFDASGAFTENQYYNLSMSGFNGNYGMCVGISLDGKTLATGGYVDHTRGELAIWSYDEATREWGKRNADGSITAGQPYRIYMDSNTGNAYFMSCQKIGISGDGKKIQVGGHGYDANNKGRIWVFDFDEETAEWGRLYADGTFKKLVSTDMTTYYVMVMNTNSQLGSASGMSADGKTIAASQHVSANQGYLYVWKFDEETREWGRWESNGTFSPNTPDNDGKYLWEGLKSYDLQKSNTFMHYGGRPVHFSADGNTLLIAYHYDHTRGRGYIWQYNEEIHAWGKWNQDGSFTTPTSITDSVTPQWVEQTSAGAYLGHWSDMSADGKTVLLSGHYTTGTAYIWQYDDETKEWGRFESSGSFTQTSGIRIYNGVSNFGHTCSMAPNNTFVAMNPNNANMYVYKGVRREGGHTVVMYTANGNGPLINPIVFSGSVTADKNSPTTYYVLGTLHNNLQHSDVRNMIYANWCSPALLTETIDAGDTKKFSKEELPFVVDQQNQIVPSYSVNRVNLYLFATDTNPKHDDMASFVSNTNFAGDLYSVITAVHYDKFNDISTMYATMMSSSKPIAKYYVPLPFTSDVNVARLADIHEFIVANSEAVELVVAPNVVVNLPPLQVTAAYSDLYDANKLTTIDATRPKDYFFFMVVQDNEGNQELSYTTFQTKISAVSKINAKIKEVRMPHVYDEENETAIITSTLRVQDTDWSNEATNNDNTSTGDYTLPSLGYNNTYVQFGKDKLVAHIQIGTSSGTARVFDYDEETDAWGKFDASGNFTKDAYHNLDKTGTRGNYARNGAISLDGKTCALGGYFDANGSGCLFVWHFDESTCEWGKWNADGSFSKGEPYDLSNYNNNWSGYYVHSRSGMVLSGDGTRLMFGAHGNSNLGRIYVLDYDAKTAAWGRKYADKTFKPYVENDFSTMYVIETNAANRSYYSHMSIDGKTISTGIHVNNNQGYVWVWKFNEETREWGRWVADANGNVTFNAIAVDGTGKYPGMTNVNTYYDLQRNGTVMHYGGAECGARLSIDGKTCAVINYYDHTRGRAYIWQYDEVTHTWGKFNADGTFVAPTSITDTNSPHMTERTGVTGYYGYGGDLAGDGKSFIQSGHNGGGTAYIWQYDDVTAKWGGFNNAGVFTENSPHRMYSGSSNWSIMSTISPDNRFVYIQWNSNTIQIFKGPSRGVRSEVPYGFEMRKSILAFKGEARPSDTKDSISEYAMLASTKLLTPQQARALFNDNSKRAAIVKGSEAGFTTKQVIKVKIPNAITENGTIVPVTVVNATHTYLYTKERGAPLDAGYEDMERFTVEPYHTKPYVVVNIVQSSFSNMLQIAGSVFSAYFDIDKVYMLLYAADADLSNVTDDELLATAESHALAVPAMTLTSTTRYNVGSFNVVPTKVIDAAGALQDIDYAVTAYQVRVVAIDTSGQKVSSKPITEEDGEFEVPTTMDVKITSVEKSSPVTLYFEGMMRLVNYKHFDLYAIAITHPDSLTNVQVRNMIFDPTKNAAVFISEGLSGTTYEGTLTHVVDSVNDNVVLASQVNAAQVYVYVKASGTIVDGGYEDIANFKFVPTVNVPLSQVSEGDLQAFTGATSYPTGDIFFRLNPKVSNSVISEHPTVTITGTGTIGTETINGFPAFTGSMSTNAFSHNSANEYTVALVTKVSSSIGVNGSFFEFPAGASGNTRDSGFNIERYAGGSTIHGQTNTFWTQPGWDYTSHLNVPVIFVATLSDGGKKMVFEVYRVSDASKIHTSVLVTSRSVGTADSPAYIGKNTNNEASNSPFGELIFYNRLLDASDIVDVVQYLSSNWTDTIPVPNPYPLAAVATAEFIPLNDKIRITAASAYSQFNNIVGMYPVVAFGKDVDLEDDTDAVYRFIIQNFIEATVDLPQYAINNVPNLPIDVTTAYADLSDPTKTVPVDQFSQLRLLIRDATATPIDLSAEPTITPDSSLLNSTDYTHLRGGYGVRKLFVDYTGPQVRLKRASDNTEQDFSFDMNGVSTEYEAWIGGSTATVIKWYDQSGKGAHGTAVNAITFDYANKRLILSSNAYFTLPDGTVPYNNDPYTFIVYHGTAGLTNGGLIGSGPGTTNGTNFRRSNTEYSNYWFGNDLNGGTYRPNQVAVARYNQSTRNTYTPIDGNGTEVAASSPATTNVMNTIGRTPGSNYTEYWTGDIYDVLIYDKALDYTLISEISQALTNGAPMIPALVTTGYSLGSYLRVGQDDTGVVMPVINWADSKFVVNEHGGDYYFGLGTSYQSGSTWFSGDGKKMLLGANTSASAGWLRVYEYDDKTNAWGKFDANDLFTKDAYHDLSKSGTFGNYAQDFSISADGLTIVVGGSYDVNQGCAFIWQFDPETRAWGKWNADKTFSAGTPHNLSNNYVPTSTWKDGYPYCYYGNKLSMNANGTRCIIGGHYNDNNRFRFYVWNYDKATCTWGGYDSSGTYAENKPYMIFKSGNSWGNTNIQISMSFDGKRIMFSSYLNNTSGKAGVMFYNEKTYQWGKMGVNGAFTAHTGDGNGGNDDHYNLDYSGVYAHYGMYSKMSGDGNTVSIGGYHNENSGTQCVWQFNEKTYEWGKWGPGGTSHTKGTPHILYRSSGVGYHSHGMDISADGRTLIVSGYWQNTYNKVFIWEYDPDSAQWGKYNSDRSFVYPTSATDHSKVHYFNHSATVTAYCKMAPNGLFALTFQSSQVRVWKGIVVEEERSIVPYGVSSSGGFTSVIEYDSAIRCSIESAEFDRNGGRVLVKGNVVADKNTNSTYYFLLATTKPLTTDAEKRAIIYGFGHFSAVVMSEEALKAKSKVAVSESLEYVVDNSADSMASYTMEHVSAVNTLYVHLYVADGLIGHEDYDVKTIVPTRVVENVVTGRAIQTNSQGITLNLSPNVEISPNPYFTMMFRFKKHSGNGTPLIRLNANEAGRYLGIIWGGTTLGYYFTSQDADAYKVNGSNYNSSLANDTYHVGVIRIDEGASFIGYWNDKRVDSHTVVTRNFNQTNFIINSIELAANSSIEIDYLVIVPDKLTEKQMASVYTNYEKNIEGFLTANNLTPTIKYCFDNDNTNAGTASNMPAISFQTPDVYTTLDDYITYTTIADVRPKVSLRSVFTPFGGYMAVTGTAFSSVAAINALYPVVGFAKGVDLSDEAAVIAFIKANTAPETVEYPQYKVNTFTTTVSTMFNDLTDATDVSNVEETGAQLRTVAVDADGNEGLAVMILNIEEINMYDVDWTNSVTGNNNTAGDNLFTGGLGWISVSSGINTVRRLVTSRTTSVTAGEARVYDFDEDSSRWGKYNANGTFVADAYHTLDVSGTYGRYGLHRRISGDGKSVVVGGYGDGSGAHSGALFVWQYDESTAAWGKYNADGSFASGVPHDMSRNVDMGAHYGVETRSVGITYDGKRMCICGWQNGGNSTDGRIWVWDYNESDAVWGTHDATGVFIPNEPYIIRGNELSSSYAGFAGLLDLSGDGKTIVAYRHTSSTAGNARALKYDEATYSWGAYNSSGVFVKNAVYNMDKSGLASHYGHGGGYLSYDGNTFLISGFYDSQRGQGHVWKYNSETHQWGKYNADGSFVNDSYMIERTGTGVHFAHGATLSADGNTLVLSGMAANASPGEMFIYQYNEETATWGNFNGVSGAYTANEPHRIYYNPGGNSNFAQACFMTHDGLYLIAYHTSANFYMYKGFAKEEMITLATFETAASSSSSSIQRATLSAATFSTAGVTVSGEVVADKENDTTYYLLAFDIAHEKTFEQVREVINNNLYPNAVVTGVVEAGTRLSLTDVVVPNLVNDANTVVSAGDFNTGHVYLFAKDGVVAHDAMNVYTVSLQRPLEFTFDDGTYYDVTNTYEITHYGGGPMGMGVEGNIVLNQFRTVGMIELGDNFFTPYSFTIMFDYKTDETAANRMLFSSYSSLDHGSEILGFHIRIYNNDLYFGVQKSATQSYLMMNNAHIVNVSAYDLSKFHRFVFKFTHSFNHVEGDKNNLKIYIDGRLVGSKEAPDGSLTQADRDAGLLYKSPQRIYLNRMGTETVPNTSVYDNIRFYKYALTEAQITEIFKLPSVEFNFDDASLFDTTSTYEIKHHDMGAIGLGVDGTIVLNQWGSSAVVEMGNDYFTPYSFTLSYRYKTDEVGANRMLFSTFSSKDHGTAVNGFHIRIHNNDLYFGVQKGSTMGAGYYLMMENADIVNVSAYDLSVFHKFVFKFTHSFNHVEGDMNNLSVYIDGQLVGSKNAPNGSLTQAERNAGIMYTNPNRMYLNRMGANWVGDKSVYDEIKFFRYALTDEEIAML